MTTPPDASHPDPGSADRPTRRGFLERFFGLFTFASASMILAPAARFLLSPVWPRGPGAGEWVDLGPVRLVTDDEPMAFPEPLLNGVVFVRRTNEGLVATSAACPHLGCRVGWDTPRSRFVCPCHDGIFDRNGDVVSGPPPGPLRRLAVRENAGVIQVRLG